MTINNQPLNEYHFKLSNGLIINLSLDFESQKKVLGRNFSHTTSSFARGYPEIIIHGDRYDIDKFEVLEKNPYDNKYYALDYEYDLSKVRSIHVCDQFHNYITLWQRHNFFMRLLK